MHRCYVWISCSLLGVFSCSPSPPVAGAFSFPTRRPARIVSSDVAEVWITSKLTLPLFFYFKLGFSPVCKCCHNSSPLIGRNWWSYVKTGGCLGKRINRYFLKILPTFCLHCGVKYPFVTRPNGRCILTDNCFIYHNITGCLHSLLTHILSCFVGRRLVIAAHYWMLLRTLKSTTQDINTIWVCPVSDLHNRGRSCLIRLSSPIAPKNLSHQGQAGSHVAS